MLSGSEMFYVRSLVVNSDVSAQTYFQPLKYCVHAKHVSRRSAFSIVRNAMWIENRTLKTNPIRMLHMTTQCQQRVLYLGCTESPTCRPHPLLQLLFISSFPICRFPLTMRNQSWHEHPTFAMHLQESNFASNCCALWHCVSTEFNAFRLLTCVLS